MKLFNKMLKFYVTKRIIPYILRKNPNVKLAYNSKVTRRGVYLCAVMRKTDVCTAMWEVPASCNVVVVPNGIDTIFWHGIEVIKVEE
jgi:hypothetical protein